MSTAQTSGQAESGQAESELVSRVGPFREELQSAPRPVKATLYVLVVCTVWLLAFMSVFIPWEVARWGFNFNLG